MKDRITQFLINENISSAEFADKIGVQRSSVSHVLNGRNSPSTSFIQKMLYTYKNLNSRWLLLGEGTMFNSPGSIKQEPSLFPDTKDNSISVVNSESQNVKTTNKNTLNNNVSQNMQSSLKSIKSSEQNPQKQEITEAMNKTSDIKDVERIILFHKDKTFTEYIPSQ